MLRHQVFMMDNPTCRCRFTEDLPGLHFCKPEFFRVHHLLQSQHVSLDEHRTLLTLTRQPWCQHRKWPSWGQPYPKPFSRAFVRWNTTKRKWGVRAWPEFSEIDRAQSWKLCSYWYPTSACQWHQSCALNHASQLNATALEFSDQLLKLPVWIQ